MRPSSHIFMAVSIISLSAAAIAQPPGPPPPTGAPGKMAGHRQSDAPRTRTDIKTHLESMFDRLDANHDGKLSSDDRTAHKADHRTKAFERVDADKNGSISKDEFAAAKPMHEQMDRPRPMRGRRAMMMHGGPHGDMGMMHRPMLGMILHPEGKAADGKPPAPLAKADFVARGLALFDKADSNHDGTISPTEHDAARQTMHGKRAAHGMMPPAPPPPAAQGK